MVHERTALAGLAMAMLMVLTAMTAGIAAGAPPGGPPGNTPVGPPDHAGNGPGGPPDHAGNNPGGPDVSDFTDTSPLTGQQVDPSSLSGKIRVEDQYADDITVELMRDSSSDFTLAITGPEDAENVAFYVQTRAFAASQDVTDVTATLDGETISVTQTEAVGRHWVAFEIDHFSTRYVTISADTSNRGDASTQGPPALSSASSAPIDTDSDGVYEDVNGDGVLAPGDATALFNAIFERNQAVRDYPAAFDVNGDGEVTVGDASVLFEQAFESST